MHELIAAYEEYLAFLRDCDARTAGFLYAHGYQWSDADLKRGEELRANIKFAQNRLEE
jgi:hypothetical protein